MNRFFVWFAVAVLALIVIFSNMAQTSAMFTAIEDWVSDLTRPVVIVAINLVRSRGFVTTASLLILLSAVVALVLYRFRIVGPSLLALRRAEIEMRGLRVSPDWRGALSAVGDVLARNSVLMASWPTYVQDALDAGQLPQRRFAFYAESDPASELNRRGGIMSALPAYYTSLGLILTFVGLVAALYFAARGFRSGDMAEARQSIIELLNASSFKFLTSVSALVAALMISVAHRLWQSRMRSQIWRVLGAADFYLQEVRRKSPAGQTDQTVELKAAIGLLTAELARTRETIELMARETAARQSPARASQA